MYKSLGPKQNYLKKMILFLKDINMYNSINNHVILLCYMCQQQIWLVSSNQKCKLEFNNLICWSRYE